MTSSSKIKEALQETKTILTEQGWTRDMYFFGEGPERCYCLSGALWKASTGREPDNEEDLVADRVVRPGDGIEYVDEYYDVVKVVGSTIDNDAETYVHTEMAIIDFNDSDSHGLSDIIEVLDKAMEKLNDGH